ERARQDYAARGEETGLFLAGMAECNLWLKEGQAERAADALDELATHPVVARQPVLRIDLLVSRVRARAELSDPGRLGEVVAEYEGLLTSLAPAGPRGPAARAPRAPAGERLLRIAWRAIMANVVIAAVALSAAHVDPATLAPKIQELRSSPGAGAFRKPEAWV